MERTTQPGILIYWEILEVMLKLGDGQLKDLLCGMKDYVLEGEEPQLSEPACLLWPIIRNRLDNDRNRYLDVTLKNRVKGLTSSFKRTYAELHGLDPSDSYALNEYLLQKGIPEDYLPS